MLCQLARTSQSDSTIECNACARAGSMNKYAELARPTPLVALDHHPVLRLSPLASRFCAHQLHRWVDDTRETVPTQGAFRRGTVAGTERSDAVDCWVSQLPDHRVQSPRALSCHDVVVPLQASTSASSLGRNHCLATADCIHPVCAVRVGARTRYSSLLACQIGRQTEGLCGRPLAT